LRSLLRAADTNGDGVLDFEEYRALVEVRCVSCGEGCGAACAADATTHPRAPVHDGGADAAAHCCCHCCVPALHRHTPTTSWGCSPAGAQTLWAFTCRAWRPACGPE
jgi:hypothetical protein